MSANASRLFDGRRRFLVVSSAVAASLLGSNKIRAAGPEPTWLRPNSAANLFRIRAELAVEGNVNVPKNPLASRQGDRMLPIKSQASFDYEERLARRAAGDPAAAVMLAQRYYHEASSRSELNRSAQTSQLRDSVRETIVRRDQQPEVIYAVEDFFRHDELELLHLPASSVAMDELLPGTAVRSGDTYRPTTGVMRSVLNLSSVEASDVVAEVVSIGAAEAKIHFRGQVDGSVEGVPTVVRTVGKLTFDRQLGACTWLAMALHETREVGQAKPGFDVSATLKILRKPLAAPIALSPIEIQADQPIPADRLYVDLRSDHLGIATLMDRRWRTMTDVPGAAMMRMLENDRSLAQCDFRALASLPAGTQRTLEAFEQDVKQTLGDQLGNLVSADERATAQGLRALRVTAAGAVQGVPIQWVLMHCSDDSGRRVLATFTMEAEHAEVFAGCDLQLADSLRLIEPQRGQDAETPLSQGEKGAAAEQIAQSQPNESAVSEVQSASDLK